MSAWSPGGRLVISDMMFGRGGSRRGRTILRQKVAALGAKESADDGTSRRATENEHSPGFGGFG